MHIIITGHGDFSLGMADALEMIAGRQDELQAIPFLQTENEKEFSEKLAKELKKNSENKPVLIFADLTGGTPYKKAVELTLDRDDVAVVGGTNLSILLEAIALRANFDNVNELMSLILPSAKDSISVSNMTIEIDEYVEEITDGI